MIFAIETPLILSSPALRAGLWPTRSVTSRECWPSRVIILTGGLISDSLPDWFAVFFSLIVSGSVFVAALYPKPHSLDVAD